MFILKNEHELITNQENKNINNNDNDEDEEINPLSKQILSSDPVKEKEHNINPNKQNVTSNNPLQQQFSQLGFQHPLSMPGFQQGKYIF